MTPAHPATLPLPSRRDFLAAAGASALVLGLGGCGAGREPVLRIATNQWPGYELLYLARDLGHLDDRAVHLVEMLSTSDSIQALAAGTVEGAGLTLDELLIARAMGIDLRAVLVFNVSAGADAVLAHPDIASLADLKGRRVGVEHTAVGALMLHSALERAGLRPSDIRIVGLTVDQHPQAYRRGEVDAVVSFEPRASEIEAAGARRLFDSRAIPGSIVDVLAIKPSALDRAPDAARLAVAAYFHALPHLRRQPADAALRMAPRLGTTPETLLRAFDGLELPDLATNRRLLHGNPSPLERSAGTLAEIMTRENLLPRPVAIAPLATDAYLPESMP